MASTVSASSVLLGKGERPHVPLPIQLRTHDPWCGKANECQVQAPRCLNHLVLRSTWAYSKLPSVVSWLDTGSWILMPSRMVMPQDGKCFATESAGEKKNPYSTTTNTMSKTQFLFKKNCKVGDFTYFCKEYYLMRQQSSLVRSKIGDHITRLPINIHIFIQIRLYHVCVLMFLDVVCILLLTLHSLFQTFYAMKHRQQTQ